MAFEQLLLALNAEQPRVNEAERYYEKRFTPRGLSILLPPELRYLQSALALTRIVVSVFEERIEMRDVHAPGFDPLTEKLRRWRRLNDLDELFSFNTLEALVTGRSYISVSGGSDGRTPTFAVETARHMVHAVDPRTRDVREVLRVYRDEEDHPHAVYYQSNRTDYLVQSGGRWVPDTTVPESSVEHGFGRPTVVPFLNRARVADVWGHPEAKPVWSLQEDMGRCLTDLAAACALMAVPQRAVFGVDERELKDADGNDVPAAQLYMSRLLTFADASGRIGEFAAAQLSQFTSTMVSYARLASAVSGVPISYFGVASEANPSSGDAQRADDDRLVKRARRIARSFTKPAREVFRLAAMIDGETDADALSAVDVRWSDPAMITIGAKADYVTKLAAIKADPQALLTPEYLLDILDLTPDQIAEMVNRDQSTLADLLDQLGNEPVNAPTPTETQTGEPPAAT